MGELISLCAKLRAEESGDDGPAWAATVALLGEGVLAETTDSLALLARARRRPDRRPSNAPWRLTAGASVRVAAVSQVLASALVLADAAEEGRKVVIGMLVTGLILAALPVLGETYMYFRYHRRGRSPHH